MFFGEYIYSMNDSPIGIFDSGIGGLTVLDECRRILPRENYLYLADFAHAPYGNKTTDEIFGLAQACVETLLSHGVKAVVAACNTATNAAADRLRRLFDVPIIGLEPALKPAYEAHTDGTAVLLCTAATAEQEKFKQLLSRYGNMNLIVSTQKNLAAQIENCIADADAMRRITEEIFGGFKNVSEVILGCTHYVFLKPYIEEYFFSRGESVKIFDGNLGAAKRLKAVLKQRGALTQRKRRGSVEFI